MDAQREVELKLEASPDELRRLQRHPLVHALAHGRAVTEALDSAYFDTADHELAAAGLGLRVRRVGARRVQTLKGERKVAGGLFERAEAEVPIDADEPDLERIPDADLRARAIEIAGGKPLCAVFRTDFRRTRRVLRNADSEWTLDVDDGEIIVGDRRAPIHEVELELRSGEARQLFEFALLLQEQFELRPCTRSKAERGYALARGEGAAAQTSRRVELDPGATVEEALVAILSQCLAHFTANADCAFDGVDPEGVHQMRVGVRRARAAFAVFAPLLPRAQIRIFRSELREVGRALGGARDLDVFTREILAALEPLRAEDPAFKRLCEEAVALRTECYDDVRALLRSARYARLVLELGAWLAARGWRNQPLSEESARVFAPAREFASALLERRHRKVRKHAARIAQSDAARHALRIALKKLRYTGEFFRDLFPGGGAKRYLRRAARLQNALGRMNDTATAERIVAALLGRLGAERARAHDRAAGFVEGWTAHLAANALGESEQAWQHLEHAHPFWS